jgi:hypothetical protein
MRFSGPHMSFREIARNRSVVGETVKRQAIVVVLVSLIVAGVAGAQSASGAQGPAQETQARGFWTDPSTGLMWAGKDSGKDVSYKNAVTYCRDLRLAGYSDWRLANMFELQGVYDKTANAPGLAGMHDDVPTMWHVKGDLFLTGYQWSNNQSGRTSGYQYYFDFNEGKSNNQPSVFPYPSSFMRALCVRGSGK